MVGHARRRIWKRWPMRSAAEGMDAAGTARPRKPKSRTSDDPSMRSSAASPVPVSQSRTPRARTSCAVAASARSARSAQAEPPPGSRRSRTARSTAHGQRGVARTAGRREHHPAPQAFPAEVISHARDELLDVRILGERAAEVEHDATVAAREHVLQGGRNGAAPYAWSAVEHLWWRTQRGAMFARLVAGGASPRTGQTPPSMLSQAARGVMGANSGSRSMTRPGTRAGPRCVSMRLRRSAGEIWLPPVWPAARLRP
jgi:hypothetical protein